MSETKAERLAAATGAEKAFSGDESSGRTAVRNRGQMGEEREVPVAGTPMLKKSRVGSTPTAPTYHVQPYRDCVSREAVLQIISDTEGGGPVMLKLLTLLAKAMRKLPTIHEATPPAAKPDQRTRRGGGGK